MSMDDVRKNLGSALTIFAKALEASVNTMTEPKKSPQLEYVDELMSYFPLAKVDEKAGTIDQYLFDFEYIHLVEIVCGVVLDVFCIYKIILFEKIGVCFFADKHKS